MSEVKGAAMELGTERIRKLLVQYAVPAIIAMTASSLYNMVDSIFIGHGVGALAISRSDSLLFRSQRCDDRLCPGVYVRHSVG